MDEHAIREYLKTIGNGGGASQETDPVFTASPAYGISAQDIADWNDKQDELVSGTNIKTINGQSLLGSGDLPVAPADYIVDEGTDGIWTYRKWNNGDAECWAASSSGAFAPASTSGGGISYRILSATFPSGLFTTAPSAHVDCKWGTGISWASARTVSLTTLEYAVCKLNNSSDSAKMYFYAVGKWK